MNAKATAQTVEVTAIQIRSAPDGFGLSGFGPV